jgi:phosphatidylinositol alpha-1,6-mannosyltransferase
MPTLRTLLLSELFPPAVGGSAVLFHGIYSRLVDTDVLVLTDGPLTQATARERSGRLNVVTRPLATRRWGVVDPKGLWQHLRLAWHLRRLISRRQGLIHCARALPEGVAAMIAHAFGGPRYVCWAHGEDLASALTSRELTWLTKCVYRRATAALANSRNTATMLGALGVPETKIHIVHPAVDADRFHPHVDGRGVRRRYAGPGDILLLSVGRLQRRKGHDIAIQAIATLRTRLPNLRYVIAGDGEERSRLEQLAADLNVQDRVFFAGIVSDADLPAFYAACDIFLLPNRVEWQTGHRREQRRRPGGGRSRRDGTARRRRGRVGGGCGHRRFGHVGGTTGPNGPGGTRARARLLQLAARRSRGLRAPAPRGIPRVSVPGRC